MRLIDADVCAEKLMKIADRAEALGRKEIAYVLYSVVPPVLVDTPTIDAEPVKHGEWSNDENEVWYCLECDTWLYVDSGTADMNYCPHCGAKMDGGQYE